MGRDCAGPPGFNQPARPASRTAIGHKTLGLTYNTKSTSNDSRVVVELALNNKYLVPR
jgi:hypothetical protein